MKQIIYADNAATTRLNKDAFEAMKPYLLDEYGNISQQYSFARKPKEAIKNAREVIARCINASPEEIFFTSGGTESNNWAIKGVKNNKVVVSVIEHHAILNACNDIKNQGSFITYIPVDKCGIISPDTLAENISCDVDLVSIMFVNNEIGTVQDIKSLCDISHKNGALFHTDAVQAIGHINVDVKELGVDLLSASAHKFNGPKGIGFLYIKAGTKIKPYITGGGQEFGLRAGTENVAAIVGMAEALKICCTNMHSNINHLRALEKSFLGKLNEYGLDYIRNGTLYGCPGNISVSFKDISGETLLHRLDIMGIMVSTGSACNGMNDELSHVIRAINVQNEYSNGTIRISFGINNTQQDALDIALAINKIIRS